MTTLKPCPFCGGKAKLKRIHGAGFYYYRVYCINKECNVKPMAHGIGKCAKEDAINTWNKRVGEKK